MSSCIARPLKQAKMSVLIAGASCSGLSLAQVSGRFVIVCCVGCMGGLRPGIESRRL